MSLHSRHERSPGISESRLSNRIRDTTSEKTRKPGRSPRHDDRVHGHFDKSNTQEFKDLDARINTINTDMNASVTVDALIRQIDPPFTKKVRKVKVLSIFKLQS